MSPSRLRAASTGCGWISDCFKATPDPDKKPFSIVMPPPNVTGQLHMGHAMDCDAAGHPDPLQADAGL